MIIGFSDRNTKTSFKTIVWLGKDGEVLSLIELDEKSGFLLRRTRPEIIQLANEMKPV